jgi:hypothetical protein
MLTCKEASVLMSQAQDRALGLRERTLLRLHLLICAGCSNFNRQLALMRAALRRLRDDN